MSRLDPVLRLVTEARAQYERDARLRRAVAAIGVLLFLVVIDQAVQWSARLDGRIAAAKDRYARTEQAAAQPEWLGRRSEAQQALAAWRDGLWRDDSPGLVQARAQTWLEGAIRESGIQGARVTVSNAVAVPGEPGVLEVVADLGGAFEPLAFGRLLAAIEGHSDLLAVRRLVVTSDQRSRFDISVYLWLTTEARDDAV